MPEKTAAKEVDGWFVTGDLARQDADGYVWFKSRKDDVIITSGYRVGPRRSRARFSYTTTQYAGVIGEKQLINSHVEDNTKAAALTRRSVRNRSTVRETVPSRIPPRDRVADALPQTTSGKIRRKKYRRGMPTTAPASRRSLKCRHRYRRMDEIS